MLDALFEPVAGATGLPVDQVRYVLLLFSSYPLAFLFRYTLHHSHTSPLTRHTVLALVGFTFATICFDLQVLLLAGVVAVSYLLLLTAPPHLVQRFTIVWVIGCICTAHIYRMITDYGGFHLDFTGPLMVLVQKLSLTAFEYHDGQRDHKLLNEDQKKHKLDTVPTVLEYFSYTFSFTTVLAGPSITMREHLDFVDGSNVKLIDNPNQFANVGGPYLDHAKEHSKEPSPWYPVLSKLLFALVSMAMYLYLTDYYVGAILDPQFNFLQHIKLAHICSFYIRCRYYFIWLLADSINNAAGLGFSGYNTLGQPQWDITKNMRIVEIETGTSLRTIANAWNVKTSLWLRRVCFERMTWHPVLCSFLLSAIWHGFYPGYYACFFYLGIGVEASKKMRRLLNHHFQNKGLAVKWSYDVITFMLTYLCVNYGALTAVIMFYKDIYTFWSYQYFVPLIIVAVAFILPASKSKRSKKKEGQGGGGGEGVVVGKEGGEEGLRQRKEGGEGGQGEATDNLKKYQ